MRYLCGGLPFFSASLRYADLIKHKYPYVYVLKLHTRTASCNAMYILTLSLAHAPVCV